MVFKNNQSDTSIVEQSSLSDATYDEMNETVFFDDETDKNMYTVGTTAAPTSSAQQSTIILLEIRNILLIFMLLYFSILCYSKIKNLLLNYTTKD